MTSLVPNIANSLIDDSSNETSMAGNMLWPFKPILLFGVEANDGLAIVFRG